MSRFHREHQLGGGARHGAEVDAREAGDRTAAQPVEIPVLSPGIANAIGVAGLDPVAQVGRDRRAPDATLGVVAADRRAALAAVGQRATRHLADVVAAPGGAKVGQAAAALGLDGAEALGLGRLDRVAPAARECLTGEHVAEERALLVREGQVLRARAQAVTGPGRAR